MTLTLVRRAALPAALAALTALLLVAPTAPAAQRVPSLVSSAQYKAFSKYVVKLRGMRTTPASAARKAELEETLTRKHGAVVGKASALFRRSSRLAKNQAQARFAASSRKVRMAETRELAGIRAETNARLERALITLDRNVDAVETYYKRADARLKKEIRTNRRQHAKTTSPLVKARLAIRIASLEKQLVDNGRDEARDLKRLNDRYRKEKRAIQASKAEETARVVQDDQALINSLRRSRERSYRLRLTTLQAQREKQLAALEDKLDAGRMAIAEMPTLAG